MKVKKVEIREQKIESSFPDIDIDIDGNFREIVIDYLKKKYGEEHAAFVGNKNFYTLKTAVQDVSSVFEVPAKEIFLVTKFIDNNLTLEENIKKNEKIKEFFEKYPLIKDVAEKLNGVLRNMSIHAGGVLITDKKYPISRYLPLQRTTTDGQLASVFDKSEVESFGFVKYDILGLNTAAQIQTVRKLTNYPIHEDIEPYEKEVFEDIVFKAKNKNIFQFETDLGKRALKDLIPLNIRDLSIASSIIRLLDQGKKGMEVYEKYRQRRLEKLKTNSDDSWKEEIRKEIEDERNYEIVCDILKESLGVLVYQEQLCFFVSRFSHGKLSFSDGNKFRKALGKFRDKYGKLEEIEDNEEKLKNWHKGMMELLDYYILPYIGDDGYTSKRQEVQDFLKGKLVKNENGKLTLVIPEKGILSWIIVGSVYIFSKLHAIAYSKMGYIQMYQKYHYPREFWYSAIIHRDKKKLSDILSSIKNEKTDIEILSPDINISDFSFTLEGKKGIRFGLSYINGLNKMAEEIIAERKKNGLFKSLNDFFERCKPNKKQIQNLLFSNAFFSFGSIEKVYKEIIAFKEIDRINDFSENSLASKEFEAISCNITFRNEFFEKAQDFLSIKDLPENIPLEVCVRIEKKIVKKTSKGRDYYFLKVYDYNSDQTFSVFEWNLKEGNKLVEGQTYILKIKKNEDFISISHSN